MLHVIKLHLCQWRPYYWPYYRLLAIALDRPICLETDMGKQATLHIEVRKNLLTIFSYTLLHDLHVNFIGICFQGKNRQLLASAGWRWTDYKLLLVQLLIQYTGLYVLYWDYMNSRCLVIANIVFDDIRHQRKRSWKFTVTYCWCHVTHMHKHLGPLLPTRIKFNPIMDE